MQHLIKKQVIQLALPKQLDAFSIQHVAAKHYRNEVLPLLEQVFDDLCAGDTVIEIPRLEIDLGEISENDMLQPDWNEAILSAIKKQLYVKIGDDAKGITHTREHKTLGIVRQWLYYMQKGYLPWNALHIDQAWYQQVLEALAVDVASVEALKHLIRENANARRRIVLQHREDFLIMLLEIITARNQREMIPAMRELQQLFSLLQPVSDTKEQQYKIWEQLLQLSVTADNPDTDQLTEKMLLANFSGIAQWEELKAQSRSGSDKEKLPGNQQANEQEKSQPEEPIDEEGIFVQYAGLVLIHPFLTRLFEKLALVDNGKFESLYAQQKALYLLHYLATGLVTAEEFELAVAKLLCNWPMDIPVAKDVELSGAETAEADNMLEAAIEQWAVLKSTSVAGLREGFLQRNGKLSDRKGKRHLQVETTFLDVLLDQLPWNLGMVKLPWMKTLLWVEWR